jgi:hypothetical protein
MSNNIAPVRAEIVGLDGGRLYQKMSPFLTRSIPETGSEPFLRTIFADLNEGRENGSEGL